MTWHRCTSIISVGISGISQTCASKAGLQRPNNQEMDAAKRESHRSEQLLLTESLGNHSRRSRYHTSRCHRQDNPKNDVGQKACPGTQDGKEPQNPHDRGIKIKIIGQAGAHARNLSVRAGAHEPLLTARLGRQAWCGCFRLFGAAVVAKARTNRDVFLAAYARHWVTPNRAILDFPASNYANGVEK